MLESHERPDAQKKVAEQLFSFRENAGKEHTSCVLRRQAARRTRHLPAPDCRRSEPAEMRPLMMKSTSKGRGERKRNLMVSMIDGCFRSMRSGGRVHCFCGPELRHQHPPSPPAPPCGLGPAVYLTVHLREGLSKVKVVGEDWGAGGWFGRVSALCRCGTSLAGQCQAALRGDETGPPRRTNAL